VNATGQKKLNGEKMVKYEGWNFNSGNYLFTTDTK